MITNEKDGPIAGILTQVQDDTLASRIVNLVKHSAEPWELVPTTKGYEISCSNQVGDLPNRARIKIFRPEAALLVIFFYKKSNVPWSRDRFAYGGIEVGPDDSAPSDDQIQAWLIFAESGFSPESRPPDLIRLFPYDIPA
ncbi:MAG TPA: hypothetical protein PK014_04390 [Thermoanaerobaculia bacterium]|nr:hypothetical protein [Thermoanaerobaculia bacterium]HUM29295.1 hypothetical protein [Thermoanaerobaculia bacterium]HXK67747.1 hypothetical protein [Thermoanaerobaculia bacterium]